MVQSSCLRSDYLDYFAVRTMTEVAILTCSRTEDKHPFVRRAVTLPFSCLDHTSSDYIADTIFCLTDTRIATITNQGYWTICEFSIRKGTASVVRSGTIGIPILPEGEKRTGWWKMEWTNDSNSIFVAESKGLYLLDIEVCVHQNEANIDRQIKPDDDSQNQ